MALQTITTIKIGEIVISNFTNLKINQKIHKHHTFSLEIGQEILESKFQSAMPSVQGLMGQKISIEIKPIPDLDDLMIITNPKDYIMHFCGTVSKVNMRKSTIENTEEAIIIKGYSDSIVLDNGLESNSFTRLPLTDIVSRIKSGYDIDIDVNPFNKEILAYTVQYNESNFNFLNRIAMRYGQWFYYNGLKMVFGSPHSRISPKLIYGINMQDFSYDMKLVPTLFKTIENDNRTGEYFLNSTAKYTNETTGFHQNYIEISNKLFNKEAVIQINQNSVGANGANTLEEYTKNKMRSIMSGMMQIKAISEVPGIALGSNVSISGVDKQLETDYRVTQITHRCDDSGGYENNFTAVNLNDAVFSPKTNPDLIPYCQSQSATVIANNDPDGLSALKVQMPWQEAKGETTPFIPMVQSYGGNGKGSHILPEIGEKVFVHFQGGNAEMPIVVGTMPNIKEKSGYSTANNDLKIIHTRSNNRLLMNDEAGSILLEDSSKSFIQMNGSRKMEFNTDVLEINVARLIINASQSTEIITNDYMLNALSGIYIFSKAMKQNIQGLMSLYSHKALINSNGAIDIEAKTAKLHGTEKALIHSDKATVINSKGTSQMHANNGNSLTNNATSVIASETDSIALAIVYFRPLPTWKGEFGFDWLREKDNGLNTEPDYKSIIEGGYKDGKKNLNKVEAYEELQCEYDRITIARKKQTSYSTTAYFVAYLSLFSKDFVDTMPVALIKPKYEADLKILLDIEEDLDKLEFDYDDNLFKLSIKILSQKNKTTGLIDSNSILKITCLKDLNSDKEINIYAYPKKGTATVSGTAKDQFLSQRKLAGRIKILKNDHEVRKEEKFVLVSTITNVNNTVKPEKGEFISEEKIYMYTSMHQALIVPTIEEATLDLSANQDFKTNSKYVNQNGKIAYWYKNEWGYPNPNLYFDTRSFFLHNEKDGSGKPKNSKFSDYFTLFKFGILPNDPSIGGAVQGINKKNAIIFTTLFDSDFTLCHEALHGLGLCHSHMDDNPILEVNRKYVYPRGRINSTNNIMSYSSKTFTSWKWQWKIINPNIDK